MILLPTAALFSLIAALAVGWSGRRHAPGCDRPSAAALLILLAFPLLAPLPGLPLLPAGSPSELPAPHLLGWLLPAGSAFLLARLVLADRRLRRWIRSARPIGHCAGVGGRPIPLLALPGLGSPCAAGVRRPVILVPGDWRERPRSQRDPILRHEIAHHQRRDPLWRWLGSLACALHWYNPLVWWLARRHALHAETACDAAVLASGVAPEHYANLLCDLVAPRPSPLVTAITGPSLAHRVGCLAQPARPLSRPALTILMIVLAATGLVCGLGRPASGDAANPSSDREIRLRLSADPFPGGR
jgi:hypothetical protein